MATKQAIKASEASFFSCSVTGGAEGEDAQPDKQPASVNASVQAAMVRTASPPFVPKYTGAFQAGCEVATGLPAGRQRRAGAELASTLLTPRTNLLLILAWQ